jgi:hypothetical protein
MTEFPALERALAEIVAAGGVEASRRIGEACVAALGVDRAAITVMTGVDRQEPIWASDDVARDLDELQFSLGEGPCVEAFTERRPVLIADLAELTDRRWPMFAATARRTPVRAVFVLPLQQGAITIGVLNLYRDTPGMLASAELAGALRAADAELWALLGLRNGETTAGAADGARRADSHCWLTGSPLRRTEVYQATGMVAEQMKVSAEMALSTLRAFAFAHERPIAEVAHDVVARRLRFDEENQ